MESITPTLIAVGCVNLLMFPVLAWILKRFIGNRMDAYDERRERARAEREEEHRENRVWRDAMNSGMRSLLRSELLREHDKWVGRRYCPSYAKEYIERTYKSYTALGGNDVGTALYKETMALTSSKPED